ncbi:hypothetical protein BGZ73_004425 [Actinomortierella ambigua]|nr:hypothetical protein BGZ73_004425 [Actinomortierella ambigua]
MVDSPDSSASGSPGPRSTRMRRQVSSTASSRQSLPRQSTRNTAASSSSSAAAREAALDDSDNDSDDDDGDAMAVSTTTSGRKTRSTRSRGRPSSSTSSTSGGRAAAATKRSSRASAVLQDSDDDDDDDDILGEGLNGDDLDDDDDEAGDDDEAEEEEEVPAPPTSRSRRAAAATAASATSTSSRGRRKSSRSAAEKVEEEASEAGDAEDEAADDNDSKQSEAGGDDEEYEGEDDEQGDTKITKDGELLGGREYRCRTFRLPDRGSKIYMLSMDPARVLGFRDSYLFFLRNPQLKRVNTTIEERQWMIDNGMLMANFKSKLIAVVTARSIFKLFGARIIKGGRSRIDDYYESRPTDEAMVEDSELDGDRGSERAVGGRRGGTGAFMGGAYDDSDRSSYKRKHTLIQAEESLRIITDLNWMHESALAVRALNSQLRELRKENPKFMDPHTNVEQVPMLKQPSICKVDAVAGGFQAPDEKAANGVNGATAGAGAAVLPTTNAVIAIPRSIGPVVDANVRVDVKPGAPAPPMITDAKLWNVIPDDIKQSLQAAYEQEQKLALEEDEEAVKYPVALLDGQFQAYYPVHQARFQQPYRVILPQASLPQGQQLHHMYQQQKAAEEAAANAANASAHDLRQLEQYQQQQQLLAQQQAQAQAQAQAHAQAQAQALAHKAMQQQMFQQHQQSIQQQQQHQQLQQQQQAGQPAQPYPMQQQQQQRTGPTGGIVCGATLKAGVGNCQRLVGAVGERCPLHRGVEDSQAAAANGGQGGQELCATCHSVQVPSTSIDANKPIPGPLTDTIQCTTCKKRYHPLCLELDTARIVAAVGSYPWVCNDCKLCSQCEEARDEDTILICDGCDRGWHMACCDPPIKHLPKGDWTCDFCKHCDSCKGAEEPGTKYHQVVVHPTASSTFPVFVCTYCTKCKTNFDVDRFCPVCLRTYRGDTGDEDGGGDGGNGSGASDNDEDDDDNNMVCCDECNRWVHMECDSQLTPDKVELMGEDESLKYTCPLCSGDVKATSPSPAMGKDVPGAELVALSLRGKAAPQHRVCGLLGGTQPVRGLIEHKTKLLAVPAIPGSSGPNASQQQLLKETKSERAKNRRRKEKAQQKHERRKAKRASTTSSLSSVPSSDY